MKSPLTRRPPFVVLTAVVGLLLLEGCAVGPNYSGPPKGGFPETPPTYKNKDAKGDGRFAAARLDADKEPRGPWWRVFHDSELDRLETLALGANQDLRQAVARIAEYRAQSRATAADFFPQAQFDGIGQRARTTDRGQRQRGQLLGSGAIGGGTTGDMNGGAPAVAAPAAARRSSPGLAR